MMKYTARIRNRKDYVEVLARTLTVVAMVVAGCCARVAAQDCPPKALPYYEDFDNDQWEFYYLTTPVFTDNCWRENFNDHAGSIANSQNSLFPDNPPGNSACCGSRYKGPPGSPSTQYGWVTILVSPELESPPTSVSFSIFSYGIYGQFYVGDSLRKRLAVGYITDTNDLQGSFVGVDTVELCAERLVWERFTVTGFENMPAPYFVAFWNDSLLQYPAWPLQNHGFSPLSVDYRFYIDSVLFDGVPIDPDPDPDPDPGTDPGTDPGIDPGPDDPPFTPEPDTLTSVRLFLPNAFTPGRIGANRLLRVGYYNLLEYEIFIYTREGLQVFHSTDPEISWDGTYKNQDCKTGSYVYIVHYRTKSRPSESYEKKGSVLLIR